MLRLGLHERGVTEILAVSEHVVSASASAAGLRLRPDVPERPSGPRTELIDLAAEPPADARRTLEEVATSTRASLGVDHVPAYWRAMARRPRLLEAIWRKHLLVLGAGELSAEAKAALALAVAMDRQSDYWAAYYAQRGRRTAGFDDDLIVEIAGAVLHYTAFNTISHGMMLEAPHRDLTSVDVPPDPTAKGE